MIIRTINATPHTLPTAIPAITPVDNPFDDPFDLPFPTLLHPGGVHLPSLQVHELLELCISSQPGGSHFPPEQLHTVPPWLDLSLPSIITGIS